jgi:hypothetical protein
MANDNDGLPRRKTARVGEADVGTTDAVARRVARPGHVEAVHIDAAVAALCDAFVLRGLRPRTVPALRVPDVVSALPVARPRRRGRRTRRAAVLAAVAVGLVVVLSGGEESRPSSRLSAAEANAMVPALRDRAAKAAGGAVHGPARVATADQFRFTFRRGRCRVIVRVDRMADRTPADARVAAGQRCRRLS